MTCFFQIRVSIWPTDQPFLCSVTAVDASNETISFFFTRFFSKPVFVLFIYNLSPSNYFENLKILTFFTFFRMLIGWVVIKYKNRVPVLCQWVKKTKIYNILHIDSHYSSNTVVYIFFILISFNRVRYFPIVKSPS